MAKTITSNATIYIPTFTGNYTKQISVLVFYPGIPVGGKIGKVYMPPLILGAVPDWEQKYVIVIPNEHTSDWSSVKKEYTSELTKVGLSESDLSVGCFSGSGNGGSSIQKNLSSLKVLNLMLMDPTSTGNILTNVKSLKSKGTNCYLMYNPNNWKSYKDIANGFTALASAVGTNTENTKSTTYDHEKIPGKFLKKWRDVIEKTLTSPGLTDKQPNEVVKGSDPATNKEVASQATKETNITYNDDPVVISEPRPDKFDLEIVGIDTTKNVVVNAKQEMPEFTIYVGGQSQFSESFLKDLDPEYSESEYSGPEEETIILPGGEVIIAFNNTELTRDDGSNETGGSGGEGVQTGGSLIVQPGGSVSSGSISLPADLAGASNSAKLKSSLDKDIISPGNGQKVTSAELYTNMNQFISDVLGPFATFLKKNYPDLYKKWNINSATRNYVPKGGSLTSQHMRGQAIDSQILGASLSNPDLNIKLLNAILTWYQNNPVGYGQILFETRVPNSCWIHWSYKRGSNKLQLLRFKNDGTLRSAAVNTVGSYVKPGVTAAALGF
jgi:hypothetical protein